MKEKLTFKIITFGCRTNQAESRLMGEKIIEEVEKVGQVDKSRRADIVIINTCCVTRKAEKEVRQAIRRVKRENPDCFLVVCGCFVENILRSTRQKFFSSNRARIKSVRQYSHRRDAVNTKKENFCWSPRMFSLIDLLVGNKGKEKIDKILKKQFNHLTIQPFSNSIYQDKYSKSKKALVKIQDGCDNFCTYCIVPYVRGRTVSRPVDEIIKEVKRLVKQGIEEVVLTGINIGSYKFNLKSQISNLKTKCKILKLANFKNDLVKLLKLILTETKVKKISFGSMGIEVFDREFIKLYAKNGCSNSLRSTRQKFFSSNRARIKSVRQYSHRRDAFYAKKENFCWSPREFSSRLTTHFHIPFQSGCNSTLKRMGRRYKTANVKFLISKLKKRIPNFTFSTDIMVGFPGETEEEFKESLRNIKEIKKILGKNFTKIHVFRYSSREGTLAAKMLAVWGRVDEKTKKKRATQVADIISRFSTN